MGLLSRNNEKKLRKYCKNGSYSDVQRLLLDGIKVKGTNTQGSTPLHIACQYAKDSSIVSLLLDQDVHVNAIDKDMDTPLHVACRNQHPDIIKVLLDRKANMNQVNKTGNTPLHIACCQQESSKIVKVLLVYGADVHAKNTEGKTPSDLAKLHRRANTVKLLTKTKSCLFKTMIIIPTKEETIKQKIETSIPLVKDVHDVKMVYTFLSLSAGCKAITKQERNEYVQQALEEAAQTTTGDESIAMFKIILEKAYDDGCIQKVTSIILDRKAENTHTANAPFVKDITRQIEGLSLGGDELEYALDSLQNKSSKFSNTLTKVSNALGNIKGDSPDKQVQAIEGIMTGILNALSFGVGESRVSTSVNMTLMGVVDFSDIEHIKAVVQESKNETSIESLEKGIEISLKQLESSTTKDIGSHTNDIDCPLVAVTVLAQVTTSNLYSTTSKPVLIKNAVSNAGRINNLAVSIGLVLNPKLKLIEKLSTLEDEFNEKRTETGADIAARVQHLESFCVDSKKTFSERMEALANDAQVRLDIFKLKPSERIVELEAQYGLSTAKDSISLQERIVRLEEAAGL